MRYKTVRMLGYPQFYKHTVQNPITFADSIFPSTKEIIASENRNNWDLFFQDGGPQTGSRINFLPFTDKNTISNSKTMF